MFGNSVDSLGKLGKPNLGKIMRKSKDYRSDIDYVIERDRKESKKKAKAWRDMRRNQIKAKRHHDRITPEDGRVLEGWDGAQVDEGYGLGDEA